MVEYNMTQQLFLLILEKAQVELITLIAAFHSNAKGIHTGDSS